jgi:hypothetical protein
MNINRRKFFRFVAAGAAAITIPSFLRGDKVQGKIYEPSKPKGFYGYQEIGHAVLDNRRVLLGSFDEEDTEAMRKSMDTSGLWNIKAGRDYTTEELAKALETPLRMGVMSNDTIGKIFEIQELRQGAKVEFPLDFLAPGQEEEFKPYTIPNCGRIPEKAIIGEPVKIEIPAYEDIKPIDSEAMKRVAEERFGWMRRKLEEECMRASKLKGFTGYENQG